MCLINANLEKSCSYGVAGIQEVYLANLADVDSVTIATSGSTEGQITAFVSGLTWYKVDLEDESGSADDSLVVSNNNRYFNHVVRYSYSEDNNSARLFHMNLGVSKVVAIVKTKNGLYKALGLTNGLKASVLNHVTGAAVADAQGYSVELTGAEPALASILDGLVPTLVSGDYQFI